jgi:hypothetical protein
VLWGTAAFEAGLAVADTIVAVNDRPFSDDVLKAAVVAAKGTSQPIRLLVKTADRVRGVDWAWAGGLRYPRLEKRATGDTSLDRLLLPR